MKSNEMNHLNHKIKSKISVNGLKYKILDELGYGAYAQVYKVTDNHNNTYALKRYKKSKKTSIESAKSEINSLLVFKHNNIIKMIDFELKKGKMLGQKSKIIVVLEYCNDNLINFIKHFIGLSVPFPEKNIIKVLSDVSSAAGYLHNLDPYIIHRDIKLDNVLIRNEDFILCDFGSCTNGPIKFTNENQLNIIEEIACLTTPAYRSPEMLSVNTYMTITAKSDVWSIGCMIYFMCFLKAPFRQNVNNVLNGELFIPQSIFSKELIYLMCLALKSNPELRVSTYQFSLLVSKMAKEDCRVVNKYNEPDVDFPKDITIDQLINKPNGQIPRHRRNISAAASIISPSKLDGLYNVDQNVFGEVKNQMSKINIIADKQSTNAIEFKHPSKLKLVGSVKKDPESVKRISGQATKDNLNDPNQSNQSAITPLKHIKVSNFNKHKKSGSVLNFKHSLYKKESNK